MIRKEKYHKLARLLSSYNDQQIITLMAQSTDLSNSLGGKTGTVNLNNQKIFFKKIPLADTEMLQQNKMSTTNFFNLPTYFQYGLGSLGFGAWRELELLQKSSDWSINNECYHFPIMYHWRILPTSNTEPTEKTRKLTEEYINRWPPEPAISNLFESKLYAKYELIVFLEYFTSDLDSWLHAQFKHSSAHAENACKMVLKNLLNITQFINERDLLHFDLHFKNILTDGDSLYLADFGLGISPSFDLSTSEFEFYKTHKNYDCSYALGFFVEWILSKYYKAGNWFSDNSSKLLLNYANGVGEKLPGTIMDIVVQYAPLALEMHRFFDDLKADIRTPYPLQELNKIYQEISM